MAAEAPAIECPRCNKKFKGKPELYGKRIRCPGCQKPFVVPSPDAKIDEKQLKDIVEVKDEAAAIKAAPVRHFFEEEGPASYSLTKTEETHRCPNCANPMESENAIVCLYCGYNTSTRTWGKKKKVIETTPRDRFMWLLPGFICLLIIFLQVVGCLYYTLVLPTQLGDGFRWMGSEALKMWCVIINLFMMWPLGYFAYWRLVMNPTPPEKEED